MQCILRSDTSRTYIIERFHGTFRERDKVLRGLKSVETAQTFVEAFRNYYNYLRPHQTLGMTSA
jgi:transposase InsO family protein